MIYILSFSIARRVTALQLKKKKKNERGSSRMDVTDGCAIKWNMVVLWWSVIEQEDCDSTILCIVFLQAQKCIAANGRKGDGQKARKRRVNVIDVFMYVLGEFSWYAVLQLVALWYTVNGQKEFDSEVPLISVRKEKWWENERMTVPFQKLYTSTLCG